ncbi:hypothetical protein J19TS2_08630 [Cohnella xylanilytica]|uniref:response regulator transcription factor n=1 Tax=Cohnella xylanilytica TaxID=557555 RepID=UPI001B0EE2E1|nr:DNA-binding response regulator [Cohnella xylanilytica]GIO11308.1 hypothetical protein J19TS2_08630 [Cohnella xylanilytica]
MQTVLFIAGESESAEWLEGWGDSETAPAKIWKASDAGGARRRLEGRRFDCVCCDLEATGFEEGLALLEWARERDPGVAWLSIVPPGLTGEQIERLDGCSYVVKPLRPGRLPAVLSRMLRQTRERGELKNKREAAGEWLLPVRIAVNRWRIGLTSRERTLLEFALGNAADELIRGSEAGLTVPFQDGFAVLLLGLPAPLRRTDEIESRCRRFAKAARNHFYADVSVSIGEPVAMRRIGGEAEDEYEGDEEGGRAGSPERGRSGASASLSMEEAQEEKTQEEKTQEEKLRAEKTRAEKAEAESPEEAKKEAGRPDEGKKEVGRRETGDSEGRLAREADGKPSRQARTRSPSPSDRAVLQRIFSYVDEHLPHELKREEIADLVHFHPAYLSRFFKSRTGTSLSRYIVNQRIEKAKVLLTQSELQVSHIVHRLGYYNTSHFTRTFKQATGFTPRQYRSVIVGESDSPPVR